MVVVVVMELSENTEALTLKRWHKTAKIPALQKLTHGIWWRLWFNHQFTFEEAFWENTSFTKLNMHTPTNTEMHVRVCRRTFSDDRQKASGLSTTNVLVLANFLHHLALYAFTSFAQCSASLQASSHHIRSQISTKSLECFAPCIKSEFTHWVRWSGVRVFREADSHLRTHFAKAGWASLDRLSFSSRPTSTFHSPGSEKVKYESLKRNSKDLISSW